MQSFPGSFYMDEGKFYKDVKLTGAKIKGRLDLNSANTYGELELVFATIKHSVVMNKSYFRGVVRCDNLSSQSAIQSKETRYKAEACFNGIKCKKISLSHSSFDCGFTMRSAKIEQFLSLNNTDVDGKADLTNCEAEELFFHNLLVDHFIINRNLFGDQLASERKKNYEQAKDEYGILKQAFETRNKYRDMDWAYYNFCRTNRKNKTHVVKISAAKSF